MSVLWLYGVPPLAVMTARALAVSPRHQVPGEISEVPRRQTREGGLKVSTQQWVTLP